MLMRGEEKAMDKQSIKDALMLYSRRGQSTQPDLWPGVQASLQKRRSAQAERQVAERVAINPNSGRRRLALVPVLVVLALGVGAAMYVGVQSPRAVSAEEIITRAQQAASKPAFQSFHGVNISHDTFEGKSTTGRMEEWFLAPESYCYDIVVTGESVLRSARCMSGKQGTWYMSQWDLAMLRDYSTIPFAGSASLDDVASDRFAYLYDRVIAGTETIQGRTAWVLDITLKSPLPPNAPDGYQTPMVHRRLWVDQEAFFVLKSMVWNGDKELISTSEFESFEINQSISPEVFNYNPPADALIADIHSTRSESERVRLWQNAAQQVTFPLQMGPDRMPDVDAGKPYLDTRNGVVTSAYYRLKGSIFLWLVLAQGPVSALPVEGEGYEVEHNGVKGMFYPAEPESGRDYVSLVLDRDGTRTLIRNYQHKDPGGGRSGAEWTLYGKLTPVPPR